MKKEKTICPECKKLKPKEDIDTYGCCEDCANMRQLLVDEDRYIAGK